MRLAAVHFGPTQSTGMCSLGEQLAPDPAAAVPPPAASRRRRLWELPTQAHEMLLATSFTPDALRREVARTLGHVHKARCRLDGRDVDVLYGAIHDLGARNPLSEALHKRLDERHALALRRWAPLRGREALLAAWQATRESDALPGELWALFTHAQGAELDAEALYDARFWVFRHARGERARAAAEAELQLRANAAEEVLRQTRQRAALQQQQADAAQRRLRDELAAALGEAAHWRQRAQQHAHALERMHARIRDPAQVQVATQFAALPDGTVSETARPGPPNPWSPMPARRAEAQAPAKPRSAPSARAAPAAAAVSVARDAPAVPAESAATPPATTPAATTIDGRHVLCVGGMRHAVARYRSRVERLGARFEHHDGGIEDGITGLDGRLQHADLVICQAACINHEAYHRIKRHCERTGKPCVYLERPSLAHFDRALAALAPPNSPTRPTRPIHPARSHA